MNKQALAPIGIFIALAVAACSLVVNADRSKVGDNLYQPSPVPDSGTAGGPDQGAAGEAGAAGALNEAGSGGALADNAGAGGV